MTGKIPIQCSGISKNETHLLLTPVYEISCNSTVNVDKAKCIGKAIIADMEGKTAAEYTFKRRSQAVTLDTRSAVKIDGSMVQIVTVAFSMAHNSCKVH